MVKIKALSPTFELPKYETELAANVDLRAYFDVTFKEERVPITLFDQDGKHELFLNNDENFYLEPGCRVLIPLGFASEMDGEVKLEILSRSGLAMKNGIIVLNAPGQVDADYRGVVGALLINLGFESFKINHKDRICQGGFVRSKVDQELVLVDDLSDTNRGDGGFGHSGIK